MNPTPQIHPPPVFPPRRRKLHKGSFFLFERRARTEGIKSDANAAGGGKSISFSNEKKVGKKEEEDEKVHLLWHPFFQAHPAISHLACYGGKLKVKGKIECKVQNFCAILGK